MTVTKQPTPRRPRITACLAPLLAAGCSVADGEPPPGAADAAPPAPGADAAPGGGDAAPDPPTPAADCFADAFAAPLAIGPDYDQFGPAVGGHCNGTDHQDIAGVERVVFLGDSVTVGTPPTESGDFYRSELADRLADRFGLEEPGSLWESVNVADGVPLLRESGDFAACPKWGARADDLLRDNDQVLDCFPPDERDKTTLVVMTVGGNDIANLTEAAMDGAPPEELWNQAEEFVGLVREAAAWFTADPEKFPGGVYIVFANMFEFTDGTGDTGACPAANLAGFNGDVPDPETLADVVVWANEQYMRIAVDTGTDMIFMLENFCGHGFNHDDPSAPCYRGEGAERWFDDTCIHPNPTGHERIADYFFSVVEE